MSIKSFDELLAKLKDFLKRQNTFRIPVSPAGRLTVTKYFSNYIVFLLIYKVQNETR